MPAVHPKSFAVNEFRQMDGGRFVIFSFGKFLVGTPLYWTITVLACREDFEGRDPLLREEDVLQPAALKPMPSVLKVPHPDDVEQLGPYPVSLPWHDVVLTADVLPDLGPLEP